MTKKVNSKKQKEPEQPKAKPVRFVYVFFYNGKTSKYGKWITSHMAFDADKKIANSHEVQSLVLYIKKKFKFYDIHLTNITIL